MANTNQDVAALRRHRRIGAATLDVLASSIRPWGAICGSRPRFGSIHAVLAFLSDEDSAARSSRWLGPSHSTRRDTIGYIAGFPASDSAIARGIREFLTVDHHLPNLRSVTGAIRAVARGGGRILALPSTFAGDAGTAKGR
jgi:hypothetical protein